MSAQEAVSGLAPFDLHRSVPSVAPSVSPSTEALPVAIIGIDPHGNITHINRKAALLLGEGRRSLLRVGMPFLTVLGPTMRKYLKWRTSGSGEVLQTWVRSERGLIAVALSQSEPDPDTGHITLAIVEVASTELSIVQRHAFEAVEIGMFVTGPGGPILAANPALLEVTQLTEDDVLGRDWRTLFFSRLPPQFVTEVNAELRETSRWRGRVVLDVQGRGERVVDISLSVRRFDEDVDVDLLADGSDDEVYGDVTGGGDGNGVLRALVAQVTDVTDGSSVEQALKEQARRDQLTGLLNRAGFLEVLEQRFADAERAGTELSLMYLDLDHFKSLNDHFGHRYGDILLESFAKRLRSSLKSTDVIGRVGGDEFVVLFDPGLSAVTLDNVFQKLRAKLLQDYQLDDISYTCTASFGSANYPWDASSSDQLLEFADHAMYQAKTAGRNNYASFDRSVFREWADREELMKSIESGIGQMQFVPYYQPIFDAATMELRGAEALVRWVDPSKPDDVGMPDDFLSLVDGSPAGVRMGIRMLDQVVVHMRAFAETIRPVSISVNLSAAQLRSEDIVARFERLAKKFPEEMKRLRVELVESAFYDGDPIIAANLARISAVGPTLSLDDFGTGHSSLLSLRAHDFTEIKIDREFLWAADSGNREDVVVLESMIELSQKLGMETVCEGVETDAQLAYLRKLGCDNIQGFLMARPMPKDEFRALLSTMPKAAAGN